MDTLTKTFGTFVMSFCLVITTVQAAEQPAWNAAAREELVSGLRASLAACDAILKQHPEDIDTLSQRGDCHFFLGDFKAAVNDYSAMIQLRPEEEASHWRRGIALFYATEYKAGAEQFETYHAFDNVDRENGIWRYFCQVKAVGKQAAQAELLRYEKDDREPFPDVYRLFSGELTADEVLARVNAKQRPPAAQQACEFYANLYVGLNAVLEGQPELAQQHLQAATNNPWPRAAGYGPKYMWHVGRLQLEQLEKASAVQD